MPPLTHLLPILLLPMVMLSLPFIDQKTTRHTRRQLQNLTSKVGVSLHLVFSSKKVGNILKTREPKPKIISEQCVIHHFKCGLCDMNYVGFTNRHLYQRIIEYTSSRPSIGKHMKHGVDKPTIADNYSVLKKCRNKLDCLIHEILFIQNLKPSLNVQSDSIR